MEQVNNLERLMTIMDELREKCPWDRKQTIHTLRQQTLEEIYELTGAITDENWKGMKEELGDVLLHIVFYSKIASEQQQFNINDVIGTVCDKLITRHPHIYGDVQVADEEEVKQNWEKLKLKEGKKSVLDGVPHGMPALIKAMRLQGKAKQVGFEWSNKEEVWDKVKEELEEFRHEVDTNAAHEHLEDEFGDLLFSLINYSRFLHIDAENALEKTNKKFQRRFQAMERQAEAEGKALHDMSLEEMDAIWNKVKSSEKQ
jgi:XTP/dITP diphosphohydrolase